MDNTDTEGLVERRQQAQRHLESLEIFLGSEAHAGYVTATIEDIQSTKDQILILVDEAEDHKQLFEILRLGGELRNQRRMLEVFNDARALLKQRIEEMLERENQNADNTKQ